MFLRHRYLFILIWVYINLCYIGNGYSSSQCTNKSNESSTGNEFQKALSEANQRWCHYLEEYFDEDGYTNYTGLVAGEASIKLNTVLKLYSKIDPSKLNHRQREVFILNMVQPNLMVMAFNAMQDLRINIQHRPYWNHYTTRIIEKHLSISDPGPKYQFTVNGEKYNYKTIKSWLVLGSDASLPVGWGIPEPDARRILLLDTLSKDSIPPTIFHPETIDYDLDRLWSSFLSKAVKIENNKIGIHRMLLVHIDLIEKASYRRLGVSARSHLSHYMKKLGTYDDLTISRFISEYRSFIPGKFGQVIIEQNSQIFTLKNRLFRDVKYKHQRKFM
ncbi:MAG: hypothetical protein HRU09_07940 [Oligoflexales bacterium]|nr:hypothetical protein [Oligoflexales bacterium]